MGLIAVKGLDAYEKNGGEPDLQEAFRELVLKHLHGRALDDNQDQEASRGNFQIFLFR
jgi:hypothetical protein